jgi:hypothetical protein
VSDFKNLSQESFPHVLDYSPTDTEKYRTEIKDSVRQCCDRFFVDRCLTVIVPDIEKEIVEQIKAEIASEMGQLTVAKVEGFSFTNLSGRYETSANSRFCDRLNRIHTGISSSAQFSQLVVSLRTTISTHVKAVESTKMGEYQAFVKAEAQKKAEEEKRRLQEEQRRQAEELKRIEAERQAELQRQQAEEERRKREREEQEAAHRAEVERLAAEAAAQREAELRAAEARQADIARIQAQQKAEEDERKRKLEAQRQADEERQRALEAQAAWLRAHPPPTVYTGGGGGGFCEVY